MWKEVIGGAGNLLTLSHDVQENKSRINEVGQEVKELRREMKQLQDDMRRLTSAVERLEYDIKDARKDVENDREKLVLQLKVAFLEFEKRLPASPDAKKGDS